MVRRIKPVSRSSNRETEVRGTRGFGPAPRPGPPGIGEVPLPAVDISEKAGEVVLRIELPGVPEKDIKILLYPNKVEISGFKGGFSLDEGVKYHRLEREYGSFRREVFVPRAIDPDRTFATLASGVLTVVLKKAENKKRETGGAGAPRRRVMGKE